MLILLLESVARAGDEAVPGFTLMDIWHHSGWLARGVIAMLAFMLISALFVAAERLLAFRSSTQRSVALAQRVAKPMQEGDLVEAQKLAKDEAFHGAYLAGVLNAGISELVLRRDAHGVANAERAVEKAVGEEVAKARQNMGVLATVGSTAPFVGLFGTTFGVINAFQGMASAGSAGLGAISSGISEALITTGVGIGVAVIGVWMFNYFNSRIEKVVEELAGIEADFMDWAHKLIQPAPQD